MNLNFYLDEAKKVLDIKADAELARRLDILPQELNRARKRGWIPDRALHSLAEIHSTTYEVMLTSRMESQDHDNAGSWAKVNEILKRAGAVTGIGAVVLSGSLLTGERANAATLRDEFQRSLLPEIKRKLRSRMITLSLRFVREGHSLITQLIRRARLSTLSIVEVLSLRSRCITDKCADNLRAPDAWAMPECPG